VPRTVNEAQPYKGFGTSKSGRPRFVTPSNYNNVAPDERSTANWPPLRLLLVRPTPLEPGHTQTVRAGFSMSTVLVTCFSLALLCSCASLPAFFLPTVSDERLEAFIAYEASKILQVSENAHKATGYKFFLAKFPRGDILGLSLGGQRIFISYDLTRQAYAQHSYLWLLRHTLAHEIAHDALGHAKNEYAPSLNAVPRYTFQINGRDLGLPALFSFRNYSTTSELAADRKAIEYWQKIRWDCRIWIKLFKGFLDQGYVGDLDHPTETRLKHALRMCDSGA
jgi:hypothetical protein